MDRRKQINITDYWKLVYLGDCLRRLVSFLYWALVVNIIILGLESLWQDSRLADQTWGRLCLARPGRGRSDKRRQESWDCFL